MPRYTDSLADALDAVHASHFPGIACLGVFTIAVNKGAYALGIRPAEVCPVHGVDCEDWA